MSQSLGDLGAAAFRYPGSTNQSKQFPSRFHYRHVRPLWQGQLPLSPTQRASAWTDGTSHLQGRRQECQRVLAPQRSPRRSARWLSFATISKSVNSHVEVNTRICQLRPVTESAVSAQEKNGRGDPQRSRPRSAEQLLGIIFRERRATGQFDLESVEAVIRSAMHRAGPAL